MPSKAQQNKLHKKNSLLSAALSLLTSNDLQDVSISDITSKAGVAKGTFYLFFKDKYEIRDYLIARESRRILQNAQAELDKNDIRAFDDAIIFMISQILNQLCENPLLLRLIRRNLSWGAFHKQLHSTLEDSDLDVSARFEQHAISAGIYYADPKMVYFMILELTGSVCYTSIVNGIPAPIEVVRPALFDAIRAILASARRIEAA